MISLNQEIFKYVEQKGSRLVDGVRITGPWADSTVSTNYGKLCTIDSIGWDNPEKVYTTLASKNFSKYTIQAYFWIGCVYEEEVKKTKKFRKWLHSNRHTFKNCYKKKSKRVLEDQFTEFLNKCPTSDLHNFVVLMGKAGLRKSEALAARWEHISQDQLEVPNGKGGKQRFVPFNKEWLKDVKEQGPVVPAKLNYWKFFNDNFEGFTPHDFRSYYATKIVNIHGMSIEDARDLLGHDDIKTTAKYLRVNKERQKTLVMENFK